MHLALFLTLSGLHLGGWRHPTSLDADPMDVRAYAAMACRAEEAALDMVFMADKLGIDGVYGGSIDATLVSRVVGTPEPLTLLSALSVLTDRIGLAGTISTTYTEPYHVARMIGSINHYSRGRIGWNAVTSVSDSEARNFGRDRHLEHAERYERAEEFIEVVQKLWKSWDAQAIVRDKVSGRYALPDSIEPIQHGGQHFRVEGPLNQPPFPDAKPVLIQAGVSERFSDIASRHAEVIFPVLPTVASARDFTAGFRNRVAAAGRDPNRVRILPGCVPIIAETDTQAEALRAELDALIHPLAGLTFMSGSMNHDLAAYAPDGLMPDLGDRIRGSRGRFLPLVKEARARGLTLDQTARFYARDLSFPIFVGAPATVAGLMAEWVETTGVDGFTVIPPYVSASEDLFLEGVVPELQKQGVFRKRYEGRTLRDHLGI
ncbi:NtaA/DmoA family FMN-dependent monooxygenase [Acetobacter conturbans]|uniref:NtaA/DmoA family FMN-dependent monooxygenase n=1 Tax=Acetobacter conturbans TaxID=1737472 RepID=A0ABX0K0Q2_9PROT|nr:NtaA/DmoA family FMN-dependent monooxygenase [Acetobacter conturbans]NHN88845.1 NtaA/DmoA family FMN-dependent monooxygenase [Acetobacter conturbans]